MNFRQFPVIITHTSELFLCSRQLKIVTKPIFSSTYIEEIKNKLKEKKKKVNRLLLN